MRDRAPLANRNMEEIKIDRFLGERDPNRSHNVQGQPILPQDILLDVPNDEFKMGQKVLSMLNKTSSGWSGCVQPSPNDEDRAACKDSRAIRYSNTQELKGPYVNSDHVLKCLKKTRWYHAKVDYYPPRLDENFLYKMLKDIIYARDHGTDQMNFYMMDHEIYGDELKVRLTACFALASPHIKSVTFRNITYEKNFIMYSRLENMARWGPSQAFSHPVRLSQRLELPKFQGGTVIAEKFQVGQSNRYLISLSNAECLEHMFYLRGYIDYMTKAKRCREGVQVEGLLEMVDDTYLDWCLNLPDDFPSFYFRYQDHIYLFAMNEYSLKMEGFLEVAESRCHYCHYDRDFSDTYGETPERIMIEDVKYELPDYCHKDLMSIINSFELAELFSIDGLCWRGAQNRWLAFFMPDSMILSAPSYQSPCWSHGLEGLLKPWLIEKPVKSDPLVTALIRKEFSIDANDTNVFGYYHTDLDPEEGQAYANLLQKKEEGLLLHKNHFFIKIKYTSGVSVLQEIYKEVMVYNRFFMEAYNFLKQHQPVPIQSHRGKGYGRRDDNRKKSKAVTYQEVVARREERRNGTLTGKYNMLDQEIRKVDQNLIIKERDEYYFVPSPNSNSCALAAIYMWLFAKDQPSTLNFYTISAHLLENTTYNGYQFDGTLKEDDSFREEAEANNVAMLKEVNRMMHTNFSYPLTSTQSEEIMIAAGVTDRSDFGIIRVTDDIEHIVVKVPKPVYKPLFTDVSESVGIILKFSLLFVRDASRWFRTSNNPFIESASFYNTKKELLIKARTEERNEIIITCSLLALKTIPEYPSNYTISKHRYRAAVGLDYEKEYILESLAEFSYAGAPEFYLNLIDDLPTDEKAFLTEKAVELFPMHEQKAEKQAISNKERDKDRFPKEYGKYPYFTPKLISTGITVNMGDRYKKFYRERFYNMVEHQGGKAFNDFYDHGGLRSIVNLLTAEACQALTYPFFDIGSKYHMISRLLDNSESDQLLEFYANRPRLTGYDAAYLRKYSKPENCKSIIEEPVTKDYVMPDQAKSVLAVDCIYYRGVLDFILENAPRVPVYIVMQEVPENVGRFSNYDNEGYVVISKRGTDTWVDNYPRGNDKGYSHRRVEFPYGFVTCIISNVNFRVIRRYAVGNKINQLLVSASRANINDSVEITPVSEPNNLHESLDVVTGITQDIVTHNDNRNYTLVMEWLGLANHLDIYYDNPGQALRMCTQYVNAVERNSHVEWAYVEGLLNRAAREIEATTHQLRMKSTNISLRLLEIGGDVMYQFVFKYMDLDKHVTTLFNYLKLNNGKNWFQHRYPNRPILRMGLGDMWNSVQNLDAPLFTIIHVLLALTVLLCITGAWWATSYTKQVMKWIGNKGMFYMILGHYLLTCLYSVNRGEAINSPTYYVRSLIYECFFYGLVVGLGCLIMLIIFISLVDKIGFRWSHRNIGMFFEIAWQILTFPFRLCTRRVVYRAGLTVYETCIVKVPDVKATQVMEDIHSKKHKYSVHKTEDKKGLLEIVTKIDAVKMHRKVLRTSLWNSQAAHQYPKVPDSRALAALVALHSNTLMSSNRPSGLIKPDLVSDLRRDKLLEQIEAAMKGHSSREFQPESIKILSFDDYLKKVEPRKRKLYKRGYEKFRSSQRLGLKLRFMAKPEEKQFKEVGRVCINSLSLKEVLKPCGARALCNPTPEVKAVLGHLNSFIMDAIKQTDCMGDSFATGLTIDQLNERMLYWGRKIPNCSIFVFDGGKNDVNQHMEFMHQFDKTHFPQMIDIAGPLLGYSVREIITMREAALSPIKKIELRFPAKINGVKGTYTVLFDWIELYEIVSSGFTFETSLGNTGRLIALLKRIFREAGAEYKKDSMLFQCGDDTLIFINAHFVARLQEVIYRYYSRVQEVYGYGQWIKDPSSSSTNIDFLSRKGLFQAARVFMIRQIERVMNDAIFSFKLPSYQLPELIRSAIQQLDSWCPRNLPGFERIRQNWSKHAAKTVSLKVKRKIKDEDWHNSIKNKATQIVTAGDLVFLDERFKYYDSLSVPFVRVDKESITL